ncbi:MAG: hypothetical protein ACREK5_07050 [Gemmatimonadota bacterium]
MIAKPTNRIVTALALVVVLACEGGPTGSPDEPDRPIVAAADARLDLADASLEKGIVLLLESQNPVTSKPDRPFGGHRTKAVSLLEKAREEIAAAKAYADDPKNQEFGGS